MNKLWNTFKKWCRENLTPKGRKDKFFANALENLTEINNNNKSEATLKMQLSAGKILAQRSIKGFSGKKSLSKVKASKHKLKKVVEHKHKSELAANKLKIQENTLIIQDA